MDISNPRKPERAHVFINKRLRDLQAITLARRSSIKQAGPRAMLRNTHRLPKPPTTKSPTFLAPRQSNHLLFDPHKKTQQDLIALKLLRPLAKSCNG